MNWRMPAAAMTAVAWRMNWRFWRATSGASGNAWVVALAAARSGSKLSLPPRKKS